MGTARTIADPAAARRRPLYIADRKTLEWTGAPGATALTLKMYTQQAENWCWAAVADCILAARGRGLGQAAVVAHHLGRSCPVKSPMAPSAAACVPTSCPNPCNGPHSIDVALAGLGVPATPIAGNPRAALIEAIEAELAAGRPVVVRMAGEGGGHFLLLTQMSSGGPIRFISYLTPYFYDAGPLPIANEGAMFDQLFDGMMIHYATMRATHFFRIAA